jgi:glycosyltransferase involved in cell wall biosynthesis
LKGLSIITPHFNDSKGLEQIYQLLKDQTVEEWEWLIVDDCSSENEKNKTTKVFNNINDNRVQIIFNTEKTNASVCRNKGIVYCKYDKLVFLDSDDKIALNFVENRCIEILDFTVFKNTNVITEKGENVVANSEDSEYLNHFLNAKFIWPITAVLWNKKFLISLGAFNPKLTRLQDVELSIRALFKSNNYNVLNNSVDFYYCVSNIRNRQNFVQPVCESVHYLVSNILETYNLNKEQKYLVRAYYFMCTKYLERSENRRNIEFVTPNLRLFYKKDYLGFLDYAMGSFLLNLYKFRLIAGSTFLKLNRYFFKTQVASND